MSIPGKEGGSYQDRINTAYVAGENAKYPGGGVGLLKQVLGADPFDIKIDKYVIIDLKGFEAIIDDLGGIDVDVPDEVYDPYYSETELPGDYFPVHVYPGKQHMDGKHALAYARVRFNSDDLDRIQRQQRVIFAAIAKANSLNVLKNAPSLWSKYKDTVKTDVNDFEIPKYAGLAVRREGQHPRRVAGPGDRAVHDGRRRGGAHRQPGADPRRSSTRYSATSRGRRGGALCDAGAGARAGAERHRRRGAGEPHRGVHHRPRLSGERPERRERLRRPIAQAVGDHRRRTAATGTTRTSSRTG